MYVQVFDLQTTYLLVVKKTYWGYACRYSIFKLYICYNLYFDLRVLYSRLLYLYSTHNSKQIQSNIMDFFMGRTIG